MLITKCLNVFWNFQVSQISYSYKNSEKKNRLFYSKATYNDIFSKYKYKPSNQLLSTLKFDIWYY